MTAAAAGLIAGRLFPAGAGETTAAVTVVRTAAEAVRSQAALLTIFGLACTLLWLITAPGWKKGPFRWALLWGSLLVLISLEIGVLPGAGGRIADLPLLQHDGATVLLGAAVLLTARLIARRPFFRVRRFALLLPGAIAALLLAYHAAMPAAAPEEDRLSYDGELAAVTDALDPAYVRYREQVEAYLEEKLGGGKEPGAEERKQIIEELNERIAELERELEAFEQVKERNERYAERIETLSQRLEEVAADAAAQEKSQAAEQIEKVAGIPAGVRPATPEVRELAVEVASSYPGPYSTAALGWAAPTEEGIRQIIALHHYISSEWDYVSDPLFRQQEYFSPADRTVAVGLAGDCDDYSILVASCIEAVGGRARIVGGSCAEGGHAWPEVYIGGRGRWQLARRVIRRVYPGIELQPAPSVSAYSGEGGSAGAYSGYWLSLDWKLGSVSCGENRQLLYRSPRNGRGGR
jgi:transglutaminase-like putative cysteine protease